MEPAFLTEHEEALLTAGFVKEFGGGKTVMCGKGGSNPDRDHGEAKQHS